MFLASGKTYGLILEDDIDIDLSFKQAIASEISSYANKWTYLQFNYGPVGLQGVALWWFLFLHDNKKRNIFQFLFTITKGIIVNIISILWGIRDTFYRLIGIGKTHRIIRDQYLAGCYIVTCKTAQNLIEINTPIIYTADRLQNIARRNKKIIQRVYVPRIVRQKREMFTSSINNNHFGEKVISY
jgi:GR25 family glycosyltransferase involved in LPS biosynthesis